MLAGLIELPGTRGMAELRERADALSAWKLALQRGWVPAAAFAEQNQLLRLRNVDTSVSASLHKPTCANASRGECCAHMLASPTELLNSLCRARVCSTLPKLDEVTWPDEPFKTKFAVRGCRCWGMCLMFKVEEHSVEWHCSGCARVLHLSINPSVWWAAVHAEQVCDATAIAFPTQVGLCPH